MSRPPTHSATARRTAAAWPAAIGAISIAFLAGGCSLLLDFSEPERPTFPEEECAFGEPNDLPAEATPLGAEPVAAALCRSDRADGAGSPDVDFFSITVPLGQLVTQLTLRFAQDGTQGNLDLYLHDATGNTELGKAVSGDDDEVLTCLSAACPSTLQPGTYLVEVRESITSLTGNRYTLELTTQ
jgi:Bacterial pre-peptidase C-terminal domain